MYTMIPFANNATRRMMKAFDQPFFREGEPMRPRMHVDVIRQEEEYLLRADLPGAKKEDVKIEVKDGVMTISAEINSEKKEEKEGYIYSERRSGQMQRSFTLEGIDEEGITAAYENGVLTIHLPRVKDEEKENVRTIAIA